MLALSTHRLAQLSLLVPGLQRSPVLLLCWIKHYKKLRWWKFQHHGLHSLEQCCPRGGRMVLKDAWPAIPKQLTWWKPRVHNSSPWHPPKRKLQRVMMPWKQPEWRFDHEAPRNHLNPYQSKSSEEDTGFPLEGNVQSHWSMTIWFLSLHKINSLDI